MSMLDEIRPEWNALREAVGELVVENTKLRELCADLMSAVCSNCHEKLCKMPKEEHPFVECLFNDCMRELGVMNEWVIM